jgi:hypothetical protein
MKALTVRGARCLGIMVGQAARGTALARILSMKGARGWRVGEGTVSAWAFEGVTEVEGATWLFGPPAAGTPLQDVLAMPLADALPLLARMAAALETLARNGISLFPLQADAVLFCDDGDVLFLPPAIMREIRDLSAFALTRDTYESLNHPDLAGEPLACFSMAVMLYRLITSRFPFAGESPEEIHERMRTLAAVPPGLVTPGLAPEVSAAIMDGLGTAGAGLREWRRRLSAWQAGELFSAVSSARQEEASLAADSRRGGSERVFHRRVFWRKHWRTVAAAAAGAAVLAVLLASILGTMLKPRLTHGYPPAKVVETWYESMNTLDHMAMQACVVGRAGSEELDQVTTLYVTSRVTQSYEGKSRIVSAAQWDAAGRPPLTGTQGLFGVTGLSVRQEADGSSPVFRAAYEKWVLLPAEAGSTADTGVRSEGHERVDRLWLKRHRGDWVISRIERTSDKPLPPP